MNKAIRPQVDKKLKKKFGDKKTSKTSRKKYVSKKPTPFITLKKKSSVKKKKSNKNVNKTTKKFVTLNALITKAKQALKKSKSDNVETAINIAKIAVNKAKRGKSIRKSRVIPLPYSGGDLDLVPIFVGLNVNGSLLDGDEGKVGKTADIISAINDCRNMQKHAQTCRDNTDQEEGEKEEEKTISPNTFKLRRSLYLHSYKNGYGLYSKIPTQIKN